MERSKDELLDGMSELGPAEPFPDEVFYKIFEIEDNVERTQYIEMLRLKAKILKRTREFNNVLQAFITDYQQRMRAAGNVTHFTEQKVELQCGQWKADDLGISMQKFDNKGMPVRIMACSHPVLPVEILKNVDTSEERVKLDYYKYGQWSSVTVNRDVCADNNSIVRVLSKIGIEVTSDNAKYLVRYISDCIGMNPAKLEPRKSINRLGWSGSDFMPYAGDIVYDGDKEYDSYFRNIKSCGDYGVWKDHCSIVRKNKIVRLAFAASFGSVLIEILRILPFVFHLWSSDSGTCKTVAIMAGMSIWGDPRLGALTKIMNGTKVGIMRSAAFLYSIPYAGDELQTMKDKYATNFDQIIYQVTEGVERIRGRASGGIEDTKTWHNSFLFNGEEPITKANSRSGSKNRVIEIEIEPGVHLMEDGNYTVSVLAENHGHAGRMLIEYLQGVEYDSLRKEYKSYFDVMCKLDTTEKQAMAMSCMLVADRILVEQIFTDEIPLSVNDVKEFLKSANEVDVAERAYQMVLNWVAKNPVRFQNPNGPDAVNKGEVWGRIDMNEEHPDIPPVAVVNKDVLCEFLDKCGMDYMAVSKKWASKNRLIRNSQGKYVHNTKVYGIKANYLKINMEPGMDEEGFMEVDEQMELPFT